MIEAAGLGYDYRTASGTVRALENVSFRIRNNTLTAIMGPSGCGKSTLLAILAGYERGQQGFYWYEGLDVFALNRRELAAFRRRETGMIFQNYNLFDRMTVYENLSMAVRYRHGRGGREFLDHCLQKVHLAGYGNRIAGELSGGERQRVAIARCLAGEVRTILADEPTGALDGENRDNVLRELKQLTEDGRTVIIATHDEKAAQWADVMIRMEAGHVSSLEDPEGKTAYAGHDNRLAFPAAGRRTGYR